MLFHQSLDALKELLLMILEFNEMKQYFFLLVMSISSWSVYAHAPNEAFFELFVSGQELLIKAEFPWTIRNVLLTANPKLKTAKTKQEMEASLLEYLQAHIHILNEKERPILIKRLHAIPHQNGHGHGSI